VSPTGKQGGHTNPGNPNKPNRVTTHQAVYTKRPCRFSREAIRPCRSAAASICSNNCERRACNTQSSCEDAKRIARHTIGFSPCRSATLTDSGMITKGKYGVSDVLKRSRSRWAVSVDRKPSSKGSSETPLSVWARFVMSVSPLSPAAAEDDLEGPRTLAGDEFEPLAAPSCRWEPRILSSLVISASSCLMRLWRERVS
jgi:hypothetical protein